MRKLFGAITCAVGMYFLVLGFAVLVESWPYFLQFDWDHEGLILLATLLTMLLLGGFSLAFGIRLLKPSKKTL
jgi:hypothetical protein